jgi:hypothetical protein
MGGFRLKRWQRIGVVLTLLWMIGGGIWGWRHAYDKVDAEFRACVAAIQTPADLQACRDTRFSALAVPRSVSAAAVGLVPPLAVWLAIAALIWLLRRIGRRFQNNASGVT